MSATETILQAALALPEGERMVLVDSILSTLGPPVPEMSEEEWRATLERRVREVETGAVKPLTWEEVQERVRKKHNV
jgi:putative addiction module component (TIGR02574 family)